MERRSRSRSKERYNSRRSNGDRREDRRHSRSRSGNRENYSKRDHDSYSRRETNDSAYARNRSRSRERHKSAKPSNFSKEKSSESASASEREVWGNPSLEEINTDEAVFIKEKANFGLTGALARDAETGNLKNGVLLKWSAPLDEATPDQHWRLYVFKEGEIVETLHIHRQASYLIGRDDRVADILLAHPSISKQHAVIQFREVKQHKTKQMVVKPYIMDLGSTHKTKLNGNILEDARYYELREKDQLKFGASTREYIIMCAEQ